MENILNFKEAALQCINECLALLQTPNLAVDLVVTRLESVILAASEHIETRDPSLMQVITLLEDAVVILSTSISVPDVRQVTNRRGPRSTEIDINSVEGLLSMNFKATQIAKMFGISIRTMHRRLNEHGISVRGSYTTIPRVQLEETVRDVLLNFPSTGYKRMRGFLLQRGIKVPELRVREVMREVDPQGVFQRTTQNRAICRRQYFVRYANQLWHIDGNLKLIRWKVVVRGGIDGKSRNCVYLEAGGDNSSQSTLNAFMKGVQRYGIPYRCRSDKGGENVLVAQYMLQQRGLGRGSHICGRSVHNQRIERFWRDVVYGCLAFYRNVFFKLEEDGLLDVNDDIHLFVLHYVYLPRLNQHLQMFMDGWNSHPLSSEHNMTPQQLMLFNLPPEFYDMRAAEVDTGLSDLQVNSTEDLDQLDEVDSITNPSEIRANLSVAQLSQLSVIDPLAMADDFGYSIYLRAIRCLIYM